MSDKIASNIAQALNAIVEQQTERYNQEFDARNAIRLTRKQKLARLMTGLSEVERQVAGHAQIKFVLSPHGDTADVTVCDRRFWITTDQSISRFEIEETWDAYSGEKKFYHRFEADDDALRFLMEALGKFIAQRRVAEQRRAAANPV